MNSDAFAPFVGRRRELTLLASIVDRVANDTGAICTLVGEPGIGKTSIAEEICKIARVRGFEVFWGWSYQGEGSPPCWPWIQVIRSYIDTHAADEVKRLMGAGLAVIGEVDQQISEKLSIESRALRLDNPLSAKFRFFDSVTTFLVAASESRPVMIVLEDLHWADMTTLFLLEFIARQLKRAPICILGTYRHTELGREHPLRKTLGELARESVFERIDLRGLTADEVREYLCGSVGDGVSEDLVEYLLDQTEGNPLFLRELSRLLDEDSGATWRTERPVVPDTVFEVIGRRLDQMSSVCRQLLSAAALLGNDFSVAVLSAMPSSEWGENILELLEEAADWGIIAEKADTNRSYRFTHVLIRERLVRGLSKTARTQLHGNIAAALQKRYADGTESHAAEIVEHLCRAEQGVPSARLARFLARAGEYDLANHAYERAARYFNQALEALEHEPMSELKANLLYGLGRAQVAVADSGATESFVKAFDYYELNHRIEKAAAVAAYPLFNEPDAVSGSLATLCRRGLKLVKRGSIEEGRLLAKLAIFTAAVLAEGGAEGAGKRFERALKIARRRHDSALELTVMAYWAHIKTYSREGDNAENLAMAQRAATLAQEAGDYLNMLFARLTVSLSLHFLRRPITEQKAHAEALLKAAERVQDRRWLEVALETCVRVATFAGEISCAKEMGDRWLSLSEDSDSLLRIRTKIAFAPVPASVWFGDKPIGTGRQVYLSKISIECGLGDLTEAQRYVDLAADEVDRYPKGSLPRIYFATVLCARMIRIDDRRWIKLVEGYLEEKLVGENPSPLLRQSRNHLRSLLAILRGDVDEAAACLPADDVSLQEKYKTHLYTHDEGLLLRTAGRTTEALDALRQAAAWNAEREFAAVELWCSYFLAETLLHRSTGADAEEAEELLRDVVSRTSDNGMSLLHDRASALFDSLSLDRHGMDCLLPDGLTRREVDVIVLVASGLTNKEIGVRLYISPHTVDTHIRHLLAKTGCANRAELAAYAERKGLTGKQSTPTDT